MFKVGENMETDKFTEESIEHSDFVELSPLSVTTIVLKTIEQQQYFLPCI